LRSSGDLRAIQFDLVYDAAMLTISTELAEGAQASEKQLYTFDPTGGTKRIVVIGMNDNVMPDGPIVTLLVEVNPAVCDSTTIPLQLTQAVAAGVDAEKVEVTASPGQIEIQPSATTSAVVKNAASLVVGPLAPGEIISIFGCGIGAGSTSVEIDGTSASILYASANQLNVIVPVDLNLENSTATLQVHNEFASFDLTLKVAPSMPGIFTQASNGAGPAVALHEDGQRNSAETPAAPESVVLLYTTGVQRDVAVEINGLPAAVESVTMAEASPGMVQIAVRIPAGMPPATSVPVALTSGGMRSQSGATIWIH
jgi:uncharacterized protein (TIGR03437 family)